MGTHMFTAAAENRTAVAAMLESLNRAADELGYDYVALLLDIDEASLRRRLDGTEEMTLTELRQVAIATNMAIRIETVAAELVH